MLINRLIPDFTFEDDRGKLTQIVSGGYCQVNAVFSKGGTERGGHYHAENTEVFFVVSGEVKVTAINGAETETETFTDGDMFSLSPGTAHRMYYTKDTVLVALYDKGVEYPDGTKDIIPFTCRED